MSAALKEALAEVERALKVAEVQIGPREADDREWWKRHRAVMDRVAENLSARLGARISDRWDGARVRLAGVTATCTAGLSGALQNWMRAAERKIRDAAAAGRAG